MGGGPIRRREVRRSSVGSSTIADTAAGGCSELGSERPRDLRTNANGAIAAAMFESSTRYKTLLAIEHWKAERAGGLRPDTPNKGALCMIFSFSRGHGNPFPMRWFAVPGKIRARQSACWKLHAGGARSRRLNGNFPAKATPIIK